MERRTRAPQSRAHPEHIEHLGGWQRTRRRSFGVWQWRRVRTRRVYTGIREMGASVGMHAAPAQCCSRPTVPVHTVRGDGGLHGCSVSALLCAAAGTTRTVCGSTAAPRDVCASGGRCASGQSVCELMQERVGAGLLGLQGLRPGPGLPRQLPPGPRLPGCHRGVLRLLQVNSLAVLQVSVCVSPRVCIWSVDTRAYVKV